MKEIKIYGLVRIEGQNRVYRVTGFYPGSDTIPKGFLRGVDVTGGGVQTALNPDHVKKYTVAISCFAHI